MAREIIKFFLTTSAGLFLLTLSVLLAFFLAVTIIEVVKALKAYKEVKDIKKEVQDDGSNESN